MRFDTIAKVLLVLGFVGISTAIAAAYSDPVTGYELSIYAGTPIAFWALAALSLLVSILVVFGGSSRGLRAMGVFLGGVTTTTVVSLPLIRGYHFLGEHDPLSHLGTARDMNAGLAAPIESPYPIVHTLSAVLHDVTGLPMHDTIMVLVVVFIVCFIVFIPLVVRELAGDVWTTYVGFFSGLLLLSINNLGSHPFLFPTSQAIMFAPAFLFVFFVLYRRRTMRHSAMFLLIAPMFVLLHPQQAANLVLFFGVIAVMQIGYDVHRGYRSESRRKWVLPEVTFFAVVFVLWATTLDKFWANIEAVYMIPFQGFQAAESTATRSVSLAEVGGDLPEVFVKLFAVSLAYILMTGLLMVDVVKRVTGFESRSGRDSITPDGGTDQLLPLYIFSGLAAVTLLFLVYLVGGISDQYFRHLGMLMVFATILGAIAIGRGMRYVSQRWSSSAARRTVVPVLVLFIVLSLPVVFPSPYMYDASKHVTEAQMVGYETTFEHRADSIAFGDIRSEAHRYGDAMRGMNQPEADYYYEGRGNIPDHFASHSLRTYYDEPVYVPVPEADRVQDPILWNGFRFDSEDFVYLDTQPGIDKVQANGGYDLYLVDPANESSSGNP